MTEIKKTALRTFMDAVKTYWGFGAALFGICSLVYAHGVTAGNGSMNSRVDSLITNQLEIRQDMTKVTTVVEGLSTELIKHESRDPNVSKEDIIDAMTHLRIEISQPVERSVDKSMDKSAVPYKFNVKIIPIKK